MDVTPGSFAVAGRYRFENGSLFRIRRKLFFPFRQGKGAQDADEIEVLDADGPRPMPFVKKSDGIIFTLEMAGRSTKDVTIRYRQAVEGREAGYIVRTTRTWGRPLDRATFEICNPIGFEDVRLSYPASVEQRGDRVCRHIEWKKRMPDRDIELRWEKP